MSKDLDDFVFDPKQCRKELEELGTILAAKADLSERHDIQPLFKKCRHLSAFIGTYAPKLGIPDRIGFEVSLFGDYAADLVVGSRSNNAYCLIEFEDGRSNSIFKRTSRSTSEWAARFEHGVSQVVDWFCMLDDFKKTDRFRRLFGSGPVTFIGILIIGRSAALSDDDKRRLHWRTDKVLIDSNNVLCFTFDDVKQELSDRLELFGAASKAEK